MEQQRTGFMVMECKMKVPGALRQEKTTDGKATSRDEGLTWGHACLWAGPRNCYIVDWFDGGN